LTILSLVILIKRILIKKIKSAVYSMGKWDPRTDFSAGSVNMG